MSTYDPNISQNAPLMDRIFNIKKISIEYRQFTTGSRCKQRTCRDTGGNSSAVPETRFQMVPSSNGKCLGNVISIYVCLGTTFAAISLL